MQATALGTWRSTRKEKLAHKCVLTKDPRTGISEHLSSLAKQCWGIFQLHHAAKQVHFHVVRKGAFLKQVLISTQDNPDFRSFQHSAPLFWKSPGENSKRGSRSGAVWQELYAWTQIAIEHTGSQNNWSKCILGN